jgi:hypothetical protein
MTLSPWCVVIVRCWIEHGELRVRMLVSGDIEGVATHASVAEASEQLAAWLTSVMSAVDKGGAADQARDNTGADISETLE